MHNPVPLRQKLRGGGDDPVTALRRKFNPIGSKDWADTAGGDVVINFDGIPLLRCTDTPEGYTITMLCQPAQYLYGAHWAVNKTIKQIFALPINVHRVHTMASVGDLGDENDKSLLYQGLTVDFTCRTPVRCSYKIRRRVDIWDESIVPYDHVLDHVRTCDRLGYFADAPVPTKFRMHEAMGGDVAYFLIRSAVVDRDYSTQFMDLLGQAKSRNAHNCPVKVAEDMIHMHMGQLKADNLCTHT
jgi:hypothetical protein